MNTRKKAVMYGAGNIGRGFIGQLFSESGYEVVFIDVNEKIVNAINAEGKYPIRIVSDEQVEEIWVENARAINGQNIEAVADEIAQADIMATAVGVNVLPRIARNVAWGLMRRWMNGNMKPLDIIICENMIDANHYLHNLVKQPLEEDFADNLESLVGFVEASIGRMVPVMTEEMQEGNPARVWVEPYCELPVDKAAFKGPIPHIKNMIAFSPFDFFIQRKLFMHNMAHATVAYLGFLKRCKYIWEAVKVDEIREIALKALEESALALSKEHHTDMEQLMNHSHDLISRFGNKLLGDTVERVGKDPLRKLSSNDRLVGAARMCLKHGIDPEHICMGIAAGFKFLPDNDEAAQSLQSEIKTYGFENVFSRVTGVEKDSPIFKLVEKYYNNLA